MASLLRRRNRKNSSPFAGILVGLGLFFGSFVLLYINEGRVDLSKIADASIPLTADTVSGENDGDLVAVSGVLHADTTVGDPELLTTRDYLQLERSAEMYAWEESRDSSEDGPTRYEYSKGWTRDPENSSSFNNPTGHFNPGMQYQDDTFTVSAATLGAYTVDPANLFFMQKEDLALREGMLRQGQLVENYIFIGAGTLGSPQVGDLRISYKAFANDQAVTVFAQQDGNQLRPYTHRDDITLYRVYPGDRAAGIAGMRTEYLTLLWAVRVGGFVLMWVGLMVFVSPLTRLLGRLPIIGEAGRLVISIVAFLVAAVLSFITIVISAVLHSPIALITLFVLLIVAGVLLWQRREGKEKTAVAA